MRRPTSIKPRRPTAPALLLLGLVTPCLFAQDAAYFEFGTIVSLGKRTVEIQAIDPRNSSPILHTFLLTPDTRADLVHPGDSVEVIYSPHGSDWTILRLVALYAGIPHAGPPPPLSGPEPAPEPVTAAAAPASSAPKPSHAAKTRNNPPPRTNPAASTATVALASTKGTPVNLGVNNAPKPAPIIPVPLGNPAAAKPIVPVSVAYARPAEECNRSSADWPSQPLKIAVIDFRYPTEKEEAHDLGRTGGGSGTAVADLVFARLEREQTEFAVDRGDRRRLDRSDFAGAARLGRQLGVDAVLAGTFAPVEEPITSQDDGPPRTKSYQLHAGLVDTCTGQLLMKLSSDTCGPASSCAATVSAREAENPEAHIPAFTTPIDTLLYPLEHNVTNLQTESGEPVKPAAGSVTAIGSTNSADSKSITIQLAPGTTLQPGDQVAIHATRLTKNPSTYTLQALHDEEIGRVSIRHLQGSAAIGTFTGDIPPRPGDTVELLSNN